MIDPGLLAAIIAEPDDDLPRLIAADWLDDHSECERADLIRTQIEAVAVLNAITSFQWEAQKDFDDLQRVRDFQAAREMATLNIWRMVWQREVCPFLVEPQLFYRGFIESITVSWQDWLTHNAAIIAATPLREVRLATWPNYQELHVIYITPQLRQQSYPVAEWLKISWPAITFVLPSHDHA